MVFDPDYWTAALNTLAAHAHLDPPGHVTRLFDLFFDREGPHKPLIAGTLRKIVPGMPVGVEAVLRKAREKAYETWKFYGPRYGEDESPAARVIEDEWGRTVGFIDNLIRLCRAGQPAEPMY